MIFCVCEELQFQDQLCSTWNTLYPIPSQLLAIIIYVAIMISTTEIYVGVVLILVQSPRVLETYAWRNSCI